MRTTKINYRFVRKKCHESLMLLSPLTAAWCEYRICTRIEANPVFLHHLYMIYTSRNKKTSMVRIAFMWFRQKKKSKFKCPLGKREIWHFLRRFFVWFKKSVNISGRRRDWRLKSLTPFSCNKQTLSIFISCSWNWLNWIEVEWKSSRFSFSIQVVKSSSRSLWLSFDTHFCFAKLFKNLPNTNKFWISIRVWEKLSFSFLLLFPFPL